MRNAGRRGREPANYDTAKRRKGSKLRVVDGTLGELLALKVILADAQKRAQVAGFVEQVQRLTSRKVQLAYVDQNYPSEEAAASAGQQDIRLEVIKRPGAQSGLVLLPHDRHGTRFYLGWSPQSFG